MVAGGQQAEVAADRRGGVGVTLSCVRLKESVRFVKDFSPFRSTKLYETCTIPCGILCGWLRVSVVSLNTLT